ncbi:hypothetical protein QFZ66_002174 [Streptomyces sp. B4I13]|nr:hypothetical protein [Streptomyces sp. B4I13]
MRHGDRPFRACTAFPEILCGFQWMITGFRRRPHLGRVTGGTAMMYDGGFTPWLFPASHGDVASGRDRQKHP